MVVHVKVLMQSSLIVFDEAGAYDSGRIYHL